MKNLFTTVIITLIFLVKIHAQVNVNTWTWIKGSSSCYQTATYGTKGVASASNGPGAVYNHLVWTYNGKMYLFGGYGRDATNSYGKLSDLWEFDHTTKNWTWLKGTGLADQVSNFGTKGVAAASNLPGARENACSWVYNGKLYLMGGESGNHELFNDLWVYDIVTNNWTWIKGAGLNISNQAGIYGTQGIAATFNTPGVRQNADTWVHNNKLYLFGGFGLDKDGFANGNSYSYLNDLWEYNPFTNNWTWLKGSNTANQLSTYGVQGVSAPNNKPGCRENFSTWVNKGLLYLMGGSGRYNNTTSIGDYNDLWVYNPNTNNWTWLKGSNLINQLGVYGTQGISDPNNRPGARITAVTWTVNNKLYLMGGEGLSSIASIQTQYLNDLWEYNPDNNNWRWLKGSNSLQEQGIYGTLGLPSLSNSPGSRDDHRSWFYNGKLYLFGGYAIDNDISDNDVGAINDMWEYVPSCSDMYSIQNGNWDDTNTWSCGRKPIVTDVITISGHLVYLKGNCVAKKITYLNGGNLVFYNPSNLQLNP